MSNGFFICPVRGTLKCFQYDPLKEMIYASLKQKRTKTKHSTHAQIVIENRIRLNWHIRVAIQPSEHNEYLIFQYAQRNCNACKHETEQIESIDSLG